MGKAGFGIWEHNKFDGIFHIVELVRHLSDYNMLAIGFFKHSLRETLIWDEKLSLHSAYSRLQGNHLR